MHLELTVCLPRDSVSIPVGRHILRDALRGLGVAEDCIADVALAQSEACANVIDHCGPGDEYEVTVKVEDDHCLISVIDTGPGFDWSSAGRDTDSGSERGRGIQLMRALVDRVHFEERPSAGMAVYLEKTLRYREDAAFRSGERGAPGG